MATEIALQDEEARRFLESAIENVKKIKGGDRKYADAISSVVFKDIMDHFKSEQGEDGPWTQWSSFYADHMAKVGTGGNRILQDTGHLRQNITPGNYRAQAEGILWFNPAKTKSGFPYAAAHNEGGEKLPKRNFMWLSDTGLENISQMTLNFLEDL
jgi:phage gpG-like protein